MTKQKIHRSITTLVSILLLVPAVCTATPIKAEEVSAMEYKIQELQEAMHQLINDEFSQCVGDSPLNSKRNECGRKSPVIFDQIRISEKNCFFYYAQGTKEQWECKVNSNERALQSLREKKVFKPFEAPDGSSKSKINSFQKI